MSAHKTIKLRNPGSVYFGKISSRGDFVKSTSGTKLISLIDSWAAQGMELLIADPDWKARYDDGAAIDFLFAGTRKHHAVCGSMIPSCDSSSRRFPFIAATMFEIDDAMDFLPLSPLFLERHINHQRALIHHIAKTHDAADALSALNEISLESEVDGNKHVGSYEHFLANTTLTNLTNSLAFDREQATVRQMILAIGYLLQPVLTNYAIPPQKGLALPMTRDPSQAAFIKALWIDLISTFLPRAEFELSIFSCMRRGNPKLIVTLNGATPSVFQVLFSERCEEDYLINVEHSAAWIEECASQEPATFKLSSYLEHDALSLRQLVDTFRQSFSG
ncbi:type VI secretion system-associated protein TagF [Noviherbaspirillum cavernae]|uniref:Type VI secretion system-associated protein TagF n=1 Tax=Noviherbaspirillum cavernae TaxID=2320862 RepID=A0A418X100_9BURK|nr:type VI secretion system-associated protein TagF [Noviherbaspirillum cavernae]RJG06131.1 type VI secretion system-associated protein TagF [Noviherbaspirillum cavernae]